MALDYFLQSAWYHFLWVPKTEYFWQYQLMFLILTIAAVAYGSITDLKTREVPDLLNYGLIAFGLGVRAVLALWFSDMSIFFAGAMGFIVAFTIALIMFYAGQWGGGDAKMIMGIGAMLGLHLTWNDQFISFLLNNLWVGAVYGLLWTLILASRNWNKVAHEIRIRGRVLKQFGVATLVIICFGLVTYTFFHDLKLLAFLISAPLVGLFLVLLMQVVKAVEKECLIKQIPVEQLTEGDWILKDVFVDKKRICGPKDLGISKEQIEQLLLYKKKGKIDKIVIKTGIPFVPSFLLSLLITGIWGNLLIYFF